MSTFLCGAVSIETIALGRTCYSVTEAPDLAEFSLEILAKGNDGAFEVKGSQLTIGTDHPTCVRAIYRLLGFNPERGTLYGVRVPQ